MTGYKNENYAKLGLGRFTSWFRPPGVPEQKRPADIDGVLHDRRGNRFILFEFKPKGAELTTGQRITLEGFSRLPNCQAIVIFDPAYDREVERYNDEQPFDIVTYKFGEPTPRKTVTLAQLNAGIGKWFAEGDKPFV